MKKCFFPKKKFEPRECSLLNTFASGVPIMLKIPIKNESSMIYAFWYALEMVHYYYEYFMFPVDIIVDISTCFSIRLRDLTVLVSNGIKTFFLIWQAQDALSYRNIQFHFDWMKPLLVMSFKCSINVTNIARIPTSIHKLCIHMKSQSITNRLVI